MKIFKRILFLIFLASTYCYSQDKTISLEEIWNGTFNTESMVSLHSMKNGQQYSILNQDRVSNSTSIDIYDYKTLQKVKTLVDSRDLPGIAKFKNYSFSDDESKLILTITEEPIYRHSKLGIYYVYDINTKSLDKVAEKKIQEPTFSPDGSKVAYGYQNNLFVKDLISGQTHQITFDGEKNKIINGIADWVYEEEFSLREGFTFVRAFDWNKNSDHIAYIRFDESEVPEFSMDIYGTGLYPQQQVFKYPKAGTPNSKVSLHIYNLNDDKTTEVKLEKDYEDFYIPRLKWSNNANVLSAQYLNRHQNALDLWFINSKNGESHLVLTETDKAYLSITDNLTFLEDNSFIWTSEKDGYNHFYHYDQDGHLINQVTKGKWDVTDYYGYDKKTDRIFYQSVENGSMNRDIYSIKLNGRDKKRLSNREGTSEASFSADFSYFINNFSNTTTPPNYTLNSSVSGDILINIIDNQAILDKLSDYEISEKEFSTITVNGNNLPMWSIKPKNFDSNNTYPLLMYQYSGAHQEVLNKWNTSNDYWFQHLAQKGYIIVCIDGRGTPSNGSAFKKVIYMQLGKFEVEDQIEAAKQLGTLPYIDEERIGIWGWSFGGFVSANALFKGNDVFKMAIAVAPVTNWRFYDSVYTERFLRTPQENPQGYDENSPINHVDKLKGDFLLVHGSGDDNVHVQNTMRLVEALIQADKQFEWAIYPDKNHGIYGGNTRLHLYKKMTNFVDRTLGDKVE